MVTKQIGRFCPVLNLCGCNTFIHVDKLCMGTLAYILQSLHKGCWMVSLDLKDAYLHVPIHPSHWRDLQFALRNLAGELIVYQWNVLPFGLDTSRRFLPNSWISLDS